MIKISKAKKILTLPVFMGTMPVDGGTMFGEIPKSVWSKLHSVDHNNNIELAINSLLIITNEKKILIDTGLGSKELHKSEKNIDSKAQPIDIKTALKNNFGISPEEVTDVILTHLHYDHCGGSTTKVRSDIIPSFPNAKYHIQQKQWDWALNPSEKDEDSFNPDDFLPLAKSDNLELHNGNYELYDFLEIFTVDGHTPGQQLVKINNGRNTLLFCADLFPLKSHLNIKFLMSYDLEPLKTIEEKKKFKALAKEGRWTLIFQHDKKFFM